MRRRSFLGLAAADAALLSPLARAAAAYRVGIGNSSDPYTATRRAVAATGEWPASRIAGKTVAVKVNLVADMPSTSGATTDPQVARALVDLALASGAAKIAVVEGSARGPAPFANCGYGFFGSYHPKVSLADLFDEPATLIPVPKGCIYQSLYTASILTGPDVFFISAAKLKTHAHTTATLTLKNLVGIFPLAAYGPSTPPDVPRHDPHFRGIDLALVDMNLARRVDYAVIDGIWGMEGRGPTNGTPVNMNVVLAGVNPVAVDLAALQVMQLPGPVQHLVYAALKGLGPVDTGAVSVVGDSYAPHAFKPGKAVPQLWAPAASPASFSPGAGQQTTIAYRVAPGSSTRADIVQDSDAAPGEVFIRGLHGWAPRPQGGEILTWDGRDDSGAIVSPGVYLAHIMTANSASGPFIHASCPVTVTA